MKRLIGFIMFWIAIGMLLMLILFNDVVGVIVIMFLLIVGYNLYSCK